MISEEQLAEWECLANEALGGKWRISKIKSGLYPDGVLSVRGQDDVEVCGPIAKEDAAFITAAREAVPVLIAEVRRLAKLAGEYFALAEQFECEADWLAKRISITDICANPRKNKRNDNCGGDEDCIKCWREAARKATQGEQ